MRVRKLMDLAAGAQNFRILRALHEKSLRTYELSERLAMEPQTVRVHLHHLRKHNFIDYEKDGRQHLYSIKTPFESNIHKIIMTLIALSSSDKNITAPDQLRKMAEADQPAADSARNEYLKGLLERYFKLVQPGNLSQVKDLIEEIKDT